MKPQELRPGNYFMAGKVLAVALEIMASGVSFDSLDGNICASYCEWGDASPIPLNEDGLVCFDFNREVDYWCKDGLILDITPNGFEARIPPYPLLATVHRLQNLYQAFSEKELIWNYPPALNCP